MHSLARILALTAVALLLAAGGAWACCDNGLVDCCDMEHATVSEHCAETQSITMDCSLDHSLSGATGTVSAKTVDPSVAARSLAPFGSSTPTAGTRAAGALSSATGNSSAELYTLFAALRL